MTTTTAAILGLIMVFGSYAVDAADKKAPAPAPAPAAAPAQPEMIGGKVLTSMNSGGYTYLEVQGAGKNRFWMAAPETKVAVGDQVESPGGMPMSNFTSKTLNRTFDSIIFVQSVTVAGKGGVKTATAEKAPPVTTPHPGAGTKPKQEVKVGTVEKAKDGYTVAEIFAKKESLKGKKVSVKGKVTKVSSGILGKNWVHLQDGSGKEGSNDLTVTSAQMPKVGDVVVATGTLTVNKDFGMGYFYSAIIEDGTFGK